MQNNGVENQTVQGIIDSQNIIAHINVWCFPLMWFPAIFGIVYNYQFWSPKYTNSDNILNNLFSKSCINLPLTPFTAAREGIIAV